MSPRIKAKKGRFGPGGLLPSITITSPANGISVDTGSPATNVFAATAVVVDDLSTLLGTDIVWTSSIDGSVGANGASTTITLTTPGAHVLTATVSDTGSPSRNVSDSINVTVV
jgi:hypothetical protein